MKYKQVYWEEVTEGQILPQLEMDISYRHAIMHVGAGRDYMRGHHEPEYARKQGQKNIYLNTLFHQSLADRVVTDWAGPQTFIARRRIAMRGAILAGDTLTGEGRVTRLWKHEDGSHRVDLEISLSTSNGLCCQADSTVVLPIRS